MRLKTSPILSLLCLLPFYNFQAVQSVQSVQSVPASAGGQGIQSALDGLPAGGEVLLSAGQYVIREPIILHKDGQTLRGCGDSTVLYLADGANCPVVILGSLSAHANHPAKGVRLADLFIDGNGKNQQREVWRFLEEGAGVYNNGVDVWGADEAAVEHVVCSHCRSGGLVASAQTRRLTVRDYEAFGNQFDGLACYDTQESHFSHLNLHDNLAAGISLDLNFNHNVIRDAVLTDNDLGIFMRQSRDNVFEGVTIKQSRHHGVFMAETGIRTSSGWRLLSGTECTGNAFRKLLITHCGGSAFRVNNAGCSNNTLCDGQFSDNAQGGLSEVAPNLLSLLLPVERAQPALPSKATPVVEALTEAAQPAHKAL
jgi:nitrous oxidase accessory protein NosD